MSASDKLTGMIQRKILGLKARTNPVRYAVTGVVTSCGRHELLERMLSSFFEYNSFPIERVIIVEDGHYAADGLVRKCDSDQLEWIATGQRIGQIVAIDYAYSRVTTPYIFHMEDDWEFYESGFIEKSMQILRLESKCLQVWLRALNDTNGHPCESQVYSRLGISWQRLVQDYQKRKWHGFSFNPGLRRLADYIETGGYGHLTEFDFNDPWKSEMAIGKFYRDRGYFAVILSDQNGNGYVRHTGIDHHTAPPPELAKDL